MAHADGISRPVPGKGTSSFWSLRLDWRAVWKISRWPVALALVLLAVVFLPRAWGWEFHCLGTGRGSWSMTSDDRAALMPLSVYYVVQQKSYRAGDVVSFDYQGNADPGENGPTVKLVESVSGSSFRFRPLNPKCSDASGEASTSAINGKVVARFSPLPRAYWRWLSMGWTLTVDEMTVRERRVFSLETATSLLSREGRLRNCVALDYPPSAVKARWGGGYILESGGAVKAIVPERTVFVSEPGYKFISLRGGELTVAKRGEAARMEIDLATGKTQEVVAPALKLPARLKARVYRNEQGLAIPLLSVPYDLPREVMVRVGDVSRTVTPLYFASSEEWGGKPACSFGGIFLPLEDVKSGETVEVWISPAPGETEVRQVALSGPNM